MDAPVRRSPNDTASPGLTMTFGGATQQTSPFQQHEVRFESATCEMCLAP